MSNIDVSPSSSPAHTQRIPLGALSLAWCLSCGYAPVHAAPSDEVVGRWKLQSHTVELNGQSFDSQTALLLQRPCASKIVYELNADSTVRLDASESSCDEGYNRIQERLYSKTKWKMEGDKLTTSSTDFAIGDTYTVTVADDRMTWVGTEGQGTMIFRK